MSARDRLRKVLEETGHLAKKSLGQNFLVSDKVIEKILAEAPTDVDRLIEIGPGPGAITEGLLALGIPLQLIELDTTMAEYWRAKGVAVMEEDALRADWSQLITSKTALISNLPYQISSSLVIDRSLDPVPLKKMVLMFQKEVAQRIRAVASTENYGMLSVIAQNFWKMKMVTEAGPQDFFPPPRIASRVLAFEPLPVPADFDRQKFLEFVKAAFSQRRKLLKSNLAQWRSSRGIPEEILLAKLGTFGLKDTARAEELTPAQFQEFYGHMDRSRK